MDNGLKDHKRRHRTCVDWMRRDLARQRERRTDPAVNVMLQMLALLSALLALAPTALISAFEVRPMRRSRYDPPKGYPNCRDAWARERGLDPEPDEEDVTAMEKPTPRLRPQPRTWRQLLRDLDSRSHHRRESARRSLAQLVPADARDWLRREIESDDRTQLRILGLGVSPAVLRDRALHAARIASLAEQDVLPFAETEVSTDIGLTPGKK